MNRERELQVLRCHNRATIANNILPSLLSAIAVSAVLTGYYYTLTNNNSTIKEKVGHEF